MAARVDLPAINYGETERNVGEKLRLGKKSFE